MNVVEGNGLSSLHPMDCSLMATSYPSYQSTAPMLRLWQKCLPDTATNIHLPLSPPCPRGEAVSSPPTCSLPRVVFFPKSLACKSDYLDGSQTSGKSKSRVFAPG